MKFTKLYSKPHNPEKAFHLVDEELVKRILYSKNRRSKNKNRVRISRGDGVIVMWFRYDYEYENFKMGVEHEDNKESWYETSKSVFSFSDDYENYNIYVVQFKSEALLEQEESEEAERYANHYFGIKEDDGRYSVYDVYSESELL